MRPVFIVGMNGSGTTMLLDSLDNHPQLYGFPRETKILPYYIQGLPKYGNLGNDENFLRLFNDLRSEFVFKVVNDGLAPPLPAKWRDLPRCLGNVIDSIYMYFAGKAGKVTWCEKTPMHVLHLSSLSELFPKAKFIHIIRDGRACAASLHRRWQYKPEVTIYRWKKIVREGRRQGLVIPDRYYEVFYEELTAEPEEWMRKICTFLDVSYDKSVLEVNRKRVITGSRATRIVSDIERWRYYFNKNEIKRLEVIGGKELNQLGYTTKYPYSDLDLSRLSLLFWLYWGYGKAKIRKLLRDGIRGRGRFQWGRNISGVIDAIRSRTTTKY